MNNKLKVLKTIAQRFNEMNVTYAIGASVLLYFKNIVNEFHDIDIVIDENDQDKVKLILNDLGTLQQNNNDVKFKTRCFLQYVVDEVEIDIIGGFVIVKDDCDYDCSLNPQDIKEYVYLDNAKIPLHSLDKWREYYYLMGRDYKVKLIDDYKKDIATK